MPLLITLISFFWFARTIKFVLFWIYLWQLKEYHVGRFLDHFRTHKGKKIFLNVVYITKFVMLVLVLLNVFFMPLLYVLLLIYIVEFLVFMLSVAKNSFKRPVLTVKTIILTAISFFGVIVYLFFIFVYAKSTYRLSITVLLFDLLLPAGVSLIVLLVQPFFVIARTNILRKAAEKMAQHKNLVVIGITGSYGKTSTKEFLTTILASKFNVLSTPDHKNSEIGIAQTILNDVKPEHQIFVVEMGSYKKGGIKLLCDMVKPTMGMVTGVNEQHLALFGSLDNLLSAEGGRELLDSLPSNGLLVVNGDNDYCLELYKKATIKKKLYTLYRDKLDSDIWTEDITVEKNRISLIACMKSPIHDHAKEMASITVNVLGKQNVQNILGAILVAKTLGMSFEEIIEACKHIRQEQAGIVLHQNNRGITIIDSSHSSNPDGVAADLDYLNIWTQNPSLLNSPTKTKKVIIMPCLIELGPTSTKAHQDIGKKIAQVCDLAIITTKDKFKELKEAAVKQGMPKSRIILCHRPHEISTIISTFCHPGDAVLLEGRVPGELIKLLSK